MSPLPTFAMRPLVSSSVLYVDLLVSTSTTTTTPSSEGMSGETRTSCDRPHACVTEATLSTTTTVRMPIVFVAWSMSGPLRAFAGAAMKHTGERHDLREPQGIGRGPFACGFAVDALGGGHQRVGRFDAFDEQRAGTQQGVHLSSDPLLRRHEQRFDVAADRVEQLSLVDKIAVGLRDQLLDPLLPRREH